MNEQRRSVEAAHLAAIVECSDDAIVSKDLEGNIRSWNAGAERMFGYTPDEIIGRSIRILIPRDRQAEEDMVLGRIRRGDRVEHFETVRLAKDGRAIDISLSVSPIRDQAGTIIGASKIARDITEQKRAQRAQAQLAAIVESSEDAIIAKNLDGIIQSCNASTQRIFGYSVSELVGQSVRILIPAEREHEEDEILSRIRRGDRIAHFETVRVAKDGRRLDISLSISPIRDSKGAIIGASKIARDITEQKRIATAFAEQQEWFRVTLASIGDAVIASDAEGRVTYLNRPAEALTGWLTEEAKGHPLTEVFHVVNEQTRRPVDNPADRVIRTGRIVGLANHSVLISRDGTDYPIADSAAPIRDKSGRIAGVVLVFRDVTEERAAEAAIAEQREWFETTITSIGDAVIATDVRGHVTFMNPIAERLTGWPIERARGRACSDVFNIVNHDTRQTVISPVTRVLEEGTVVGLANHTVLIAADGTERPIDDSGAPIKDRNGRMLGVVLVFRDVSDRSRIDLERRDAAAERERLLEAERAARAEAERANRVKDDFLAMVSHELRTPLNAILGWTQLIGKSPTDQQVVARGMDVIARNTRMQAQLISDLFDISRIVAGKLSLAIESVDLATMIDDAVNTVQQAADDKRIVIDREIDAAVQPIAGDPARLHQIVCNLLSNAIKFTPEGGQIEVGLHHRASDVEISIADTGMGIASAALPHIFDRFQQADRSITRRFGGLGLGLSIVKHLVELHGGTVIADSRGEGQGATFTIVLPSSAVRRAATDAGGTSTAEGRGDVSLDGIRILVVEDEPATREYLQQFLTTCGASVVTAASAAEALAVLSSARPDILVSDIGLPDEDGFSLIQRIRALGAEAGGAIPAIALTAYARSQDRTRAFRAGYQSHLAKPIEPTELVATIRSFAAFFDTRMKR